jgi:hypothetical protein
MNLQNIKKLLNVYFIENWRRDLLSYFLVFTGCAFLLSFSYVSKVRAWCTSYSSSMDFWIVLATFVLVSYLFVHLSRTSSSIHYLTIPATTGEKIVTNMLIANIYYVVLAFVAIMIGLGLSVLVNLCFIHPEFALPNSILSNWEVVSKCYVGVLKGIAEILFPMYILISVAFFGAVYFKKRALLKTAGSMIVLGWTFGLIALLTIVCLLGSFQEFENLDIVWTGTNLSVKAMKAIAYVAGSCVILYNYALSFLRLRETEV